MVHDGTALEPYTTEQFLVFGCREGVRFYDNGGVKMPGFNSAAIHGKWAIEGGRLHLLNMDTLSVLFDGPFQVAVNERELTLRSERTTIYCTHLNNGF